MVYPILSSTSIYTLYIYTSIYTHYNTHIIFKHTFCFQILGKKDILAVLHPGQPEAESASLGNKQRKALGGVFPSLGGSDSTTSPRGNQPLGIHLENWFWFTQVNALAVLWIRIQFDLHYLTGSGSARDGENGSGTEPCSIKASQNKGDSFFYNFLLDL